MNKTNNKNKIISKSYLTITLLGISYKLNIKYTTSNCIELVKKENSFDLILSKKYKNVDNLDIINHVVRKLYSETAPKELEKSLDLVRYILKFAPEDYKIERLPNAFYKTKNKILIINPDIIQYNEEIINTTLIQAICKIKYKANSKEYKNALNNALKFYDTYKNSHLTNNYERMIG